MKTTMAVEVTESFEFRVSSFEVRVPSSEFRVPVGFRVSGHGSDVGLGFRVSSSEWLVTGVAFGNSKPETRNSKLETLFGAG